MQRTARARSTRRSDACGLLALPQDILHHIFAAHLPLEPFAVAGATCKTLNAMTHDATLLVRVVLEETEPPEFEPQRERLLFRCCVAGNAAPAYRLGVAYAYHPRLTAEHASPLDVAASLLRRALELGEKPEM